jgi:cellulose synthase/poly-beta-1,6-N-acetylglucosamine synthase-like glycosyltransferase
MAFLVEFISTFWLILVNGCLFLVILGFAIQKRIPKTKIEPPVSIIVAVWNEGPRIKLTIESLLKQTYPKRKTEIIVVGGGKDNTAEICRKLQRKGYIRYLFEKEKMGKWYALQRALKLVKYEYIAFVDADCVAERNWLRKLVSEIGENDLIISRANTISTKKFTGKIFSFFYPFMDYFYDNLTKFFKLPTFFGFGSLMKKSVLKGVQFRKSIIEDWRFGFEMIRKKYSIIRSDDALVYHHIPNSFGGVRKAALRVFEGYVYETIPRGDWFAFSFTFLVSIGVIGIFSTIYLLFLGNSLTTVLTMVSFLQLFLLASLVSFKEKNTLVLLSVPVLVVLYFMLSVFAIETLLRILLGKNVGWLPYEKIS